MPVEICQYKHGRLLYLPNDIYMGRFLTEYGEYSEGEVQLFARLLRPGESVVIEAGANIGCHTIPLARLSQALWVFEPQPRLYMMLCGNIALNNLSNVMPTLAAIGAETGVVVVPNIDYDAELNFGGLSMQPLSTPGHRLPLMALDVVFSDIPRLDFIKADVEGMEYDLLVGAQRVVERHRPVLYIEDDRTEQRERLYKLLRTMNYELYRHSPRYVPDRDLVSLNLLCLPKEKSQRVADDLSPIVPAGDPGVADAI